MTDPVIAAPRILSREDGATIAYHQTPGAAPGVVFLHGLMSDMTGGKALYVEDYCRERGRAFLRFDYSGHGASSGDFTDGTVGRWAEDAACALEALTDGPQVLVGSSLGGWIMLLAALGRPERVAGLVGIAAAPDFTEDIMPAVFTPEQKRALERDGRVDLPSDYGDAPYTVTRRLLEEGRDHLLLRRPIALSMPVRLIHGMKDADVPWRTSLALAEKLDSDDVEVEPGQGRRSPAVRAAASRTPGRRPRCAAGPHRRRQGV